MANNEHGEIEKSTENEQLLDDQQLSAIDKALALQAPIARKYVEGLKKKNPSWDEERLVSEIEKRFIRLATLSGAGIGGTAALPALGTVAAVALTVGEGVAFAEACAFLTLGVAHARGINMSDPEARKTVLLGILGGEKGEEIVAKALGKNGMQWSTVLNGVAPQFATKGINKQVNSWIRKAIMRRLTGIWAGRLLPFGIGAAIGGVGNNMLAKSVVEASRAVFAHRNDPVPSTVVNPEDTTK